MNRNHYPELDDFELDRFEEFVLKRIERYQPEVEYPTGDPDLSPAEREAKLATDDVVKTINRS